MTKSSEQIEKRIEAQLEKLKQLKAQKQAIEARERTKQKGILPVLSLLFQAKNLINPLVQV